MHKLSGQKKCKTYQIPYLDTMNDVIAKHILSCYTHATQSIVFSSYEPWPIPIFVHSCMNDSDNYMQLFKKLNEKKTSADFQN